MQTINYVSDSNSKVLLSRFKQKLAFLKGKYQISLTDFQNFVIEKEPEFNSPEGLEKIRNTWYKNGMNIRVCELLKEYENHLNQAG